MAWKSMVSRLTWLLLKQETVGFDAIGNKYYRRIEKQVDGSEIEKRLVKLKAEFYDPTAIPPEWSQWLSKTRNEPPTQLDVDKGAHAQEQYRKHGEDAARAAELADRRFREQQTHSGGGGAFKPQLGGEHDDGGGGTTQR